MMYKIVTLIGMMFLSYPAFAQQSAVTQTGEQVVLYIDGTWVYAETDSLNMEEITLNEDVFTKSKKASFLMKSKRINIGCWLDPKKWTFKAAAEGDASEYDLEYVNGSLYGMMITENLDINTEMLVKIALQNARMAAPDIKVIANEYRIVNGLKVLMIRMIGTIEDMRFSYFGYYYAGDEGSVQFLLYASEPYMKENVAEVESLLNGLVILAD